MNFSWVDFLFIFVLGLCFGSFLTCLANRIVYKQSLINRSSCFYCSQKLGILELVPVFSFVFLKARCKHCGTKLSFLLLLGEIFGAFLLCWAYFLVSDFTSFCILALIFFNLFLLALIDYELKAVPEFLLWTLFLFSFLFSFNALGFIDFLFNTFSFAGFVFLLKSFLSFLTIFFTKDKNSDNLGDADIIVLACMAGILGFEFAFLVFFLASLFSLPFFIVLKFKKSQNQSLAFLPFLTFSFLLVFSYQNLGVVF